MLDLGVRRGDAVRLGKQHVRNGAVHFVPNKTRHKKMDAIELRSFRSWRVVLPRAHAAT
jgi:hypothetical protein